LHRATDYAGIEIEVNQKYVLTDRVRWTALRKLLVATLAQAMAAYE
jgi:hypothetical protein